MSMDVLKIAFKEVKPRFDLSGSVCSELRVIKPVGTTRGGAIAYLCLCNCGNETYVEYGNLKSGSIKSCGCFGERHRYTHRMSKTVEYEAYNGMMARCYRTTHKNYDRYGGRGIRVCKRWKGSFESFYEDMGNKPSDEYTVDRIDNDGDYSPENCKWATRKEQTNNRGCTIRVLGIPLAVYCEKYGLKYSAVYDSCSCGFDITDAIFYNSRPRRLATPPLEGLGMTLPEYCRKYGLNCSTISSRYRRNGRNITNALFIERRKHA